MRNEGRHGARAGAAAAGATVRRGPQPRSQEELAAQARMEPRGYVDAGDQFAKVLDL